MTSRIFYINYALNPMNYDPRFLELAIRIGNRQLGRTGPNPAVGCVIVQNNRVVGASATSDGGRPHAEVVALQIAGDKAKDASVYVSLEPCAHHGQTAPCTQALINANIKRVICPVQDPDPRVSGKGFAMLQNAGIEVIKPKIALPSGLLPFLFSKTHNRAMLTWKSATSIDGKIALSNGKSKWISGDATRAYTRDLRAHFDAIMVGVGTILADDPSLTVGNSELQKFAPVPVILDSQLRTPIKSKIFQGRKPIIFHSSETEASSPLQDHAFCIPIKKHGPHLCLSSALGALTKSGINSCLLEGGAKVVASALQNNLVDSILHVSANTVMGSDAIGASAELSLSSMNSLSRFQLDSMMKLQDDVLIKYKNPVNLSSIHF